MRIIVAARIAGTTVGHIDHAMAYAVGLKRLGHEVYLIEQAGSGRCRDQLGHEVSFEAWDGRRHFETVTRASGLWPRCALIYKRGDASHGMTYRNMLSIAKSADLLITRSGRIDKLPDLFERPAKRVFIDGNPGATQVGLARGDEAFQAIDHYEHLFTMGLNVGRTDNFLPTSDRLWHPILRPVVLPMWPMQPSAGDRPFATISTWRGRATLDWRGQGSGEKADNWLVFLEMPKRTDQPLEIAMGMDDPAAGDDRQLFERYGWRLADPKRLSTLDDHRRYITSSRAEFSVAHNRYVAFQTGWFSDRSAVYLASGRPILVQSTGIEDHLPTGMGLLTFKTVDEAVAGIETINGNYPAHCQAARDIAEAHFDSERVLSRMLDQVT